MQYTSHITSLNHRMIEAELCGFDNGELNALDDKRIREISNDPELEMKARWLMAGLEHLGAAVRNDVFDLD